MIQDMEKPINCKIVNGKIIKGLRPLYDYENEIDRYIMSNPNINIMPIITKSLVHFMNEEDIRRYNIIPDIVTIYRGANIKEGVDIKFGQSWSLSYKIAEFFAYKYRSLNNTQVHIAKIPKQAIYFYFNGREEQEVVIDTAKIRVFVPGE